LKYYLSFRIFEQLVLVLTTELPLNFSSPGVGSLPPSTPLHVPTALRCKCLF